MKMKTLKFTLTFCVAIMLIGCASTVNTTQMSYVQNSEEAFFLPNDIIPSSALFLGTIRIGDSGFSINCGLKSVIKKATDACKKMGGNAIQLVSIDEPDFSSTCYRITAYALRIDRQPIDKSIEKTGYTEKKLKEEWIRNGTDEIEGIYERLGDRQSAIGLTPKYTLAVKKKNNAEYDAVYLSGALLPFQNNWIEGDLKAKIIKTATPNFYKVDWYLSDKSKYANMYITFDKGLMNMFFSDNNSAEVYIKLYPTAEGTGITGSNNSSSEWKGNGSGFFIDRRGYIATNYHVIKGATEIEVNFNRNGENQSYKAKVLQSDRQNDLAILQIDDNSFTPFTNLPYNFNTNISDVGSNIFALGYPLTNVMGTEIKFTDGKISSKTGYQGDITVYQISVPIQPGNSGGALFDYDGNLIGITSSGLDKSVTESVNYAIKSSYLKNLIDVLPVSIRLPNDRTIANKTLTEKIKILSDYVVLIKVR